jgi:hypothetical protein
MANQKLLQQGIDIFRNIDKYDTAAKKNQKTANVSKTPELVEVTKINIRGYHRLVHQNFCKGLEKGNTEQFKKSADDDDDEQDEQFDLFISVEDIVELFDHIIEYNRLEVENQV